jgi:hypothetical protein
VSTKMSLMAEIPRVMMNSHTIPARNDICALERGRWIPVGP